MATHRKARAEEISYVIQRLGSIYPLSEELQTEFYNHVECLQLQKDQVLVKQGSICDYMYLILKGAVMAYSVHNTKKITTYISIENEFVSSITGLHGTAPSQETMVAVEPTYLLAIHNDILQELFKTHFDLNYLFRVMVEQYYRDAQERSYIIRIGNARERYLYFAQSKPGYIERLPLESVASLLDMKPTTLQRFKKQYASLATREKDAKVLCEQINSHILEQLSYKNKTISLASLAGELGLSTHKLSSLLNNNYHLSFNDFINTYRINSIKNQIITTDSLQNFTMEALAYEAGFSSRSAFYSAFKKLVGESPAQYFSKVSSHK